MEPLLVSLVFTEDNVDGGDTEGIEGSRRFWVGDVCAKCVCCWLW